ncbi:MAG: Eco57I restriction-modification methylase domain-containing protein, partial [Bacteroidales bacterium]|nr:Eco57I restriction-modification methylase domain-containing protein [Bacteroidales bacterium]
KKVHDLVGKDVKINAIVGNPPYQVMDGGAGVSAKPVYNLFVEMAKLLKPSYISMIMPSRWFAGGKGLDTFRENMLSEKRISHIFDYINAKDCFPTASIGGGINYILWDEKHNGNCNITTIQGAIRDTENRPLNQFSVFIRYNSAIHILNKCSSEKNFSSIVNTRNPFGLSSNVRGNGVGELRLISSAGISWLPVSAVPRSNPLLGKYKILMSKVTAEHAGEPDKNGQFKIVSRTEVIGPNDVCTDSYLIIGASESKSIVDNEYKYIQTRFARFLLMLSVSSINLSSDKFQFIPMQDFTSNSDIDWIKSVAEIDAQLYTKYGLSDEEIAFIESMIKPM